MTIWNAREAKRPDPLDGPRILCGRHDLAGVYLCNEQIASWPFAPSNTFVVLAALVDAGSPGTLRWSNDAEARIARGQAPRDRRHRRNRDEDNPRDGKWKIIRGPVTLPCAKRHLNVVDAGLLRP